MKSSSVSKMTFLAESLSGVAERLAIWFLFHSMIRRACSEIASGPFSRFVRKTFRPTYGVVNARQARVGTELVKQFLAKCEKAGVREVFGNVAVDALADHPFLLDWYEGLGFSRAPADGRAEFFPIASKVIWRNPKL
jgi:hypothetical protein